MTVWIGYGFAFGLLFTPVLSLPDAVAYHTVAVNAGMLVAPAPGGLGVREALLLQLLQDDSSPAVASVNAWISRLLLVSADVLVAIVSLISVRRPRPTISSLDSG